MANPVVDALESVAGSDRPWKPDQERTATNRDAALLKRRIVRFLGELPGEMTVEEVRDALDQGGAADE